MLWTGFTCALEFLRNRTHTEHTQLCQLARTSQDIGDTLYGVCRAEIYSKTFAPANSHAILHYPSLGTLLSRTAVALNNGAIFHH